jgi:hypothetical protein
VIFCAFCDELVDPDQAYRKVEGWELPRPAGGANQITLRRVTGDYAHAACVTLAVARRKAGVASGQGDLFE